MSAKKPLPPHVFNGLTLRLLRENDLPLTLAWRNHDDSRIWFKQSDALTLEQHARWFDQYLGKDNDYVFIVERDARPVGQAAVYDIDWASGRAEVGRFLAAPAERGRGHLFNACGALIGLCRDRLALSDLFLEVFAHNHRAIRVYQGNGFKAAAQTGGLLRMEKSLAEAL